MEKVANREKVTGKPKLWQYRPTPLPFCPGCQHGLGIRAVLEAIEELDIEGRTILLAGAGCTYPIPAMVDLDAMQCPRGRAPDIATTMKRFLGKGTVVITYQDDDDAITIGTEALIQSASRGERITVIMANNGSYQSSGWQMAPPAGEIAAPEVWGPPLTAPVDIVSLLCALKGVVYVARGAANTSANYLQTKGYIKTALQKQIDDAGFSFVEILLACPTNWQLSPEESLKWIEEKIIVQLPLGEFMNLDRI